MYWWICWWEFWIDFKKLFTSFGLFYFSLPIEASTDKLFCTYERSYLIKYRDEISNEDKLTRGQSKLMEDKKSKKEFKVSYDLKNSNGFIEKYPAIAFRVLDPQSYSPLFLYSYQEDLPVDDLTISTPFKEYFWNIRIHGTDFSSWRLPFFATKSIEENETRFKLNDSNEILEETQVTKKTLEISEGFCNKIK